MYTGHDMASLKLANVCLKSLERVGELESPSLPWKDKAQPLYHTRKWVKDNIVHPRPIRYTLINHRSYWPNGKILLNLNLSNNLKV